MVSATELKEFYNSTFFDEFGKPKKAHIVLSVKAGEKEITVPGVKVHPDDSLDSVFKAFYEYLLKAEDIQPDTEETTVVEAENGPREVKEVIFNHNAYLVEWQPDDNYIVRRSDNGVLINEKSPTAKGAVKAFRELKK